MPIFVDDTEAVNEKVNSFSAFISTKIIIDEKENKIFIKGINYDKFLIRIKDMYETKSVNKLFTKNYTPFTQKLWEKKKIPGYKRKVTNLEVDLFFASELYNILMQLGDYYNLRYYRRMAEYIKKNTYLDNLDRNLDVKVDINRLNSILNEDYKPKDFQEEFIKKYFEYKEIYDLDGYILSFDQGLGKTFTAACISELIHPDQTIIVCMNTLKENWANELRLYFKKYNDIERFKREVYVYGVSKPKEYSKDTRYIIVNNESINKIFPLVKNTNSTMIIVDESQNFRNLDSLQTKNMLKLKQITKSKDNLMMSGTPIKANPSEIVPAMMMIDRTFTLDLAKLYIKAFTSNTDTLSDVVQTRFNRTIYRKTKDQVLDLPSKTVTNFKLEYKDEDPYLMINVKKRVADRFQEILESYKDEVDSVKDEFRETTLKYSSQDRTTTLDYIKFVDKGQDYESVHDSLYDLYDGFIKNNVYPNIKDKDELKRYKYVVSVYVYITQKCFFLAMGEVLPKVKAKAFNELYDNNKDLIYKMINNNPKKTVIFSTIVEVVDHIYDDLNKNDIKAVKITGSVKNRMDIINQFREDDTVDVLVATSQTMGTGVTLVEANQMMVFCPPYRKADFDQACDRIYRIGQTHPVNIYNIIGSTSSKDITTRMTDILDWSDQMVSSVLDNIVNEEALIEKYKGEDTNMAMFEEAIYDSKVTERNQKKIKEGDYSYNESNINIGIIKKSLLEMDNADDIKESTLLTETLEDFLNNGMTVSESLALNEATLSSKERKSLPDKTFGLPEKRKFPLNDYDHVVLAIKFFNRCDKKDQEELAKNIIKAMKVYKVPAEKIGKNNKLRNYINGPLKEFAIHEGLFSKYKTVTKEIPPKVSKKDAITKAYQIGDELLSSTEYRSIKKYVKKLFTNKDEYASFIKGETNDYALYSYKVPDNAQGRRDIFGPEFNEKEDNDYDWVDDSLIYKFGGEFIKLVNEIDNCYSISEEDNELYEGDFYLSYHKATKKVKVDKKTGKEINESVLDEGLFSKYKTEKREIIPKVSKKEAANKIINYLNTLLNGKYKNFKPYVEIVVNNKSISDFTKETNSNYIINLDLYNFNVPEDDKDIQVITYGKCKTFEEYEDKLPDNMILDLYHDLQKFAKNICDNMYDIYCVPDQGWSLYGTVSFDFTKKYETVKVNKKTGKVVNESVGNPVVGITNNTPVIVDNMYNNAFTSLEMDEEIIRNCMMSSTKALLNKEDKFYVPYIPYIQESLNIDPNIGFYRDRNGIFVMNENTKLRSPSYNDVDDIDDRTILYITYGELNDSKLNDL